MSRTFAWALLLSVLLASVAQAREAVTIAADEPRLTPKAVAESGDNPRATGDIYTVDLPRIAGASPITIHTPKHPALELRSEVLVARDAQGREVWRDAIRPVEAVVEGHTVRYPGAFAGVDDEYAVYTDRIKHDAVLQQPLDFGGAAAAWIGIKCEVSVPAGYPVEIDWFGSSPETGIAHSLDVLAPDESVAYHLMALHATDAAGAQIDGRYRVLEREPGRLLLVAEFPVAWLEQAAYPVRLDPPVVIDSPSTISRARPFEDVGLGIWSEASGIIWWSPNTYQAQTPPSGYISSMAFQAAGAGTFQFDRLLVEIRETTRWYDGNWTTNYNNTLDAGAPSVIAYDGPWTWESQAPGDWVEIHFTDFYEHTGTTGGNGVAVIIRLDGGSGSGNGSFRYATQTHDPVFWEGANGLWREDFNAISSGGTIANTAHVTFQVDPWYVSTPLLPDRDLGDLYVDDTIDVPFEVEPASANVTYTPVSALPPGISWDTQNDALVGTVDASTAGTTQSVDIEVDDGGTHSVIVTITWEAYAYPEIVLDDQAAVVGEPFSATPQVTGGKSPFDWLAIALPAWAAIDPDTGEITGTPDAADLGTGFYSISTWDANGRPAGVVFELTVREPLDVLSTSLPPATENGPNYAGMVEVSGGSNDLSFAATGLPGTMTIDPATGAITGSPDEGDSLNSPYTIDVTVEDVAVGGTPIQVSLDLEVVPAPVLATTELPTARTNQVYLRQLDIEHGVAPFDVSITNLPEVFSYVAELTAIYGEPDSSHIGTYDLTIEITDANGATHTSDPITLRVATPIATADSGCATPNHHQTTTTWPHLLALALLTLAIIRRRIIPA